LSNVSVRFVNENELKSFLDPLLWYNCRGLYFMRIENNPLNIYLKNIFIAISKFI
jgi:hypothetical protein